MAQTSTTLLASKEHIADKTGTIISFTKTGTEYKISSSDTGTINLGSYSQFDLITVSGASNSGNNSTFTVKSVSDSNDFIIVEEEVTTESAGQSITLNHIGFVSDKFKGDGYYSQPDGVHTVSYTLSASYTADAILKMQGSLATTPTEDDWFDISGTSFTTDGTTIIKNVSFNFTGNIVWVRAKATGVTGGTINSVLLNN
tara:strand:- start:981 stop:1580 length:600 start_codon:yes stop_codon:yes gene_type:complete